MPCMSYMVICTPEAGSAVSWGLVPWTAAGGIYRLCWCRGPGTSGYEPGATECKKAEDFNAYAGTLTIQGVAPLSQHRTCVSGQTCRIDGIFGQYLSSTDRIVVLDTCGTNSFVPGFPPESMSVLLQEERENTLGTLSVSWSEVPVLAVGGQYRLCWQAGGFGRYFEQNASVGEVGTWTAQMGDSPLVDFGGLLVVGPAPLAQRATCVSGQTCAFDALAGFGLADGDQLALLDTCGALSLAPRITQLSSPYYKNETGDSLSMSGDGTAVSWGAVRVTAAGQSYRMCWCKQGFACSSAEMLRVDLGEASIMILYNYVQGPHGSFEPELMDSVAL